MDEKIRRVAMVLAAIDGMPPEHFHAHDESFRIEYYRRSRAVISAYESALADDGYAIVPNPTTEQITYRTTDSINTQTWIDGIAESIRTGSRRVSRIWKL